MRAGAIRLGVVGCGHIAIEKVSGWQQSGKVRVVACMEPDDAQFARFASNFAAAPFRARSIEELVSGTLGSLHAVYVATPHVFHSEQAVQALRAGLDVLLEKPMAFTVPDARRIEREATASGSTLVVSFDGSLSPRIRAAADSVARWDFGKLHVVSGMVSENWATLYSGHWKQDPEMSGGGFLIDSGCHLLNAAVDVAGCGIETVSARFVEVSPGVEVNAVISGRMCNGALLSLAACGNTLEPCVGRLDFFFEGAVVRVDPWGKRPSMVRRGADPIWQEIPHDPERQQIDYFREICEGRIENPSSGPHNVELARLWIAIRKSAQLEGQQIRVDEVEG